MKKRNEYPRANAHSFVFDMLKISLGLDALFVIGCLIFERIR